MPVPFLLGERIAVLLGVAFVVPPPTVGEALEQERALTAAGAGEEGAERVPHRGRIAPLHRLALEPVRSDDVGDTLDHGVGGARRELGKAVVLAHEDDGELPERRQIHRLAPVPGLNRAIAEEDGRDIVTAARPRRERRAEREREVPADDAGRTHEPVRDVDEMHRPAEAATEPVIAPHQLGHHPVERCALGDRVTVGTVTAVHRVAVAQLTANAAGDPLPADAQMDEPVDLEAALQLRDALLEAANPPHRRQQVGGVRKVETDGWLRHYRGAAVLAMAR